MRYPDAQNYIAGRFVPGKNSMLDVYSPLNGEVISHAPLSTDIELDLAVKAAQKAFVVWSSLPIKERVQVLYRYRALLLDNIADLASLIREENGKTRDTRWELWRPLRPSTSR
jgi:malonate-semialdehyde dehydrogenase (acetylating)/methylmalonate-semialdehyde dehydrogenase